MVIKHKNIFKTESAWSNADKLLLCLDTGSWRTERPVLDKEKCNYCGLCALYCPPQCMTDMNDYFAPNLDFCKGCGICAKECPRGAIAMVPEGEFADGKS
jgi:pyruvate ferredoxin oxidoreductase delta subunit